MRRPSLMVGGLVALLAVSSACTSWSTGQYPPPTPAGLVKVCNTDGDCWIFDGPPCKDWKLTTSTCTDIPSAIAPVATGSSAAGRLTVEHRQSEIVLQVEGRQPLTKTVLDLKPLKATSLVGVLARIATAPGDPSYTQPGQSRPSSRELLDLVVALFDKTSRTEIGRRSWLVDITDPAQVTPVSTAAELAVACPAGTYPPKCYPCLGCAPCPGRPTEYCDIVWAAIFNPRVNPDALAANTYALCNGRLQPTNR
jgi:hypothetical protein